MAGQFVALPEAEEACTIKAEGLVAQCALGTGQALIIGDAAMLDNAAPYPGAEAGLRALLQESFGLRADFGDFAHADDSESQTSPANTRNISEISQGEQRQQE